MRIGSNSLQWINIAIYSSYTCSTKPLSPQPITIQQLSLFQHQGIMHLPVLILHKLKHKCSSVHSEP